MTGRNIRVGLVGAGYIADWHAGALKAVEGVTLAGVCDRSMSAAQALATRNGVAAYNSLAAMLEGGGIDAVHVLTPPDSHAALAIEALEGGVHCLVEKPAVTSLDEAERVVAAGRAAGRRVAPGHNFLGVPAYGRLKALMEAGELGRVGSAEINWHLPLAPLRSGPYGLWLMREPRNLLLEIAPHLLAFAQDLFGAVEVEHLSASKPVGLPGGDSRPQGFRILARAGSVDLTLAISLVETIDDRSVVMRGSAGLARLDYAADTLSVQRENASDIVINPARRQLSLAGQALREGARNAWVQGASLYRRSPYALSFAGMVDAVYSPIREGRPADARFDEAALLAVARSLDAVTALLPEHEVATPRRRRKPRPDVMVIGGTGFIGRALTQALIERGRDVRILSRGKGGPFAHLPDRVETVSARLDDADALAQAIAGMRHVYHLGKSLDTTWEDALKNDVGVTEAIGRAALSAGVEHFVYTGTIASYDMSDPDTVITEATGFADDMSDRNIYARSKALCEARLQEMHLRDGLPLTIARPGIVVGKGGPLQHWGIGRWHGAGAVRIWGDGRNPLPFVLIDDVAEGLARIVEVPGAIGESVNLVGPPILSARGYFQAIQSRLGARIDHPSGAPSLFWLAGEAKYRLKRHVLGREASRASLRDWKSRAHLSRFDNAHARRLLEWEPVADRETFLRRAVDEADLFGF